MDIPFVTFAPYKRSQSGAGLVSFPNAAGWCLVLGWCGSLTQSFVWWPHTHPAPEEALDWVSCKASRNPAFRTILEKDFYNAKERCTKGFVQSAPGDWTSDEVKDADVVSWVRARCIKGFSPRPCTASPATLDALGAPLWLRDLCHTTDLRTGKPREVNPIWATSKVIWPLVNRIERRTIKLGILEKGTTLIPIRGWDAESYRTAVDLNLRGVEATALKETDYCIGIQYPNPPTEEEEWLAPVIPLHAAA